MCNPITVTLITILLIAHCSSHQTSICDSNKMDFSVNHRQITSTNDYLELNHKVIDYAADDAVPPDQHSVECNDFVYFSGHHTYYVRRQNLTDGDGIRVGGQHFHCPRPYASMWFDGNENKLYLGTNDGLWLISECGEKNTIKINATEGIFVIFAVIDHTGNVYFGNNNGDMFLLRKDDQQRVSRINGIEESSFIHFAYFSANYRQPSGTAVDTNNNVYVGVYSDYIYVIKSGESTAIKLKDIKSVGGITSIVADSRENVYFRTNNALYGSKSGGRELTKIADMVDDHEYSLWLDRKDNLYFQFQSKKYVLQSEPVTSIAINTISNSNGFNITAIDVGNLRNLQVKNNVFYFTSSSTDGEKQMIFALRPNETSLRLLHTTDGAIASLAVDNSNNIYFNTFSTDLQDYATFVLRINDGNDIPIEIRGINGDLTHLFSDNQNNIFFGTSNGLYVLLVEEVTPFKVGGTESRVTMYVVDRSDNVYFSTPDGAFVLRSGELKAIPVEGIHTSSISGVHVFGDKKFDVIYFQRSYPSALYKLRGGEIAVKTIVEDYGYGDGFGFGLFLTNCMNDKTFYVRPARPDSDVSRIFHANGDGDKSATLVTEVSGRVLHIDSDSFDNLFFITDTNQLHMVRPKQLKLEVIVNDLEFTSLNVDRDNDVYLTSKNGDAYVIRSGEIEPTKIENISGDVKHFITNGDDKLFVTAKHDKEAGLFLIRKKFPFETALTNRNLGQIDNNEDETIFNILNYLNRNGNYLLNKSKTKIINKTPTSATVVATDGKFMGSFNIAYTVKREDDDSGKNVNLLELLKAAAFFEQTAKNVYDFRNKKKIRNITISAMSLTFSPVEVTAKSELAPFYEFKSICFSKKQFANPSPLPQTIKLQECTYETKETISFRITAGLNKTDSEVKDSMDSVLNSEDENVLLNSFNVYGNSQAGAPAKITLSDAFDLSNLNQHSHEIVLDIFRENEQEIIVPPKQRALVNYSVRTFVVQTVLNLQQKIKGRFVAKVSYTDSDELIQMTIKNAMQTLQKYKMMPSEITVNQDSSITFNGNATLTVKRESDTKIIRNFSDL